jgi:hypothetical protein
MHEIVKALAVQVTALSIEYGVGYFVDMHQTLTGTSGFVFEIY